MKYKQDFPTFLVIHLYCYSLKASCFKAWKGKCDISITVGGFNDAWNTNKLLQGLSGRKKRENMKMCD